MKSTRRSSTALIACVSACVVCVATGYWAGRLYAIHNPEGPGVPAKPLAKPYYSLNTTQFHIKPTSLEPVCTNTCAFAKNGICDDGTRKPGVTSGFSKLVRCDLGTDCDDCGPWTPSGHAPWITDNRPGPIQRLMEAEVQVRVRTAGMNLGFDFAYTDPTKDVDVSHHMEANKVVEGGITELFYRIFREKCDPAKNGKKGPRALFVDVGANFGWFSVLAASLGCRVLAFEPVPHFHAFFEYSVHLNGLAHLVDMRGNVVSHVTGTELKMVVPSKGIWGTAGIDGLNIDKAITGSINTELTIPSQRLDDVLAEDVLLLKVDVEGWEWSVMQGAAGLLSKYNVENIIMEYSPGVPERSFRMGEIKATIMMLVNMVDAGYRIAHLGDITKHSTSAATSPLPTFEEVTVHNLMYDLLDAELFSRQWLGCPVPPLLTRYPAWSRCQGLPEDPNPKSLRSIIGHNTNIWASKNSGIQSIRGVVGILPLDAPADQFYASKVEGKPTLFGMGSRSCPHLPPTVQIRHRCPCTDRGVCGAESDALDQTIAAGQMASNYVLDVNGKLVSGAGHPAELLKEFGTARKIGDKYRPGAVKDVKI